MANTEGHGWVRRRFLLCSCSVPLLLANCAGSPGGPHPSNAHKSHAPGKVLAPSTTTSQSPSDIAFERTNPVTVTLRGQGLRFALPDARRWRRANTSEKDTWWKAEHQSTASRLSLRRWNRRQLSDAADCRADAAILWGATLRQHQGDRIAKFELEAPAGYPMRVSAHTHTQGARVEGTLSAFSARLRTCIAIIYQTSANGRRGAALVGRRLAYLTDRVLPSLREVNIEDRIKPKWR